VPINKRKKLEIKHNIKNKVQMILEKERIILKPIGSPRKNWEKAFEEMSKNNDDTLLFNDVFEDENFEEWY